VAISLPTGDASERGYGRPANIDGGREDPEPSTSVADLPARYQQLCRHNAPVLDPPITAHMGGLQACRSEASDKAYSHAHRPTGACNSTQIIANQYTQPDRGGPMGVEDPQLECSAVQTVLNVVSLH
jgi:hypothetical protein